MDRMYMSHPEPYVASPMSYSSVPDLVSSSYDDDTDPCPSPPVPFAPMDNYHYNPYQMSPPTSYADYTTPKPTLVNSIEFTDLTQIQHEERLRGQRRSNATQDKEAASNMRIRRRAQNRASQRAFRERKEKHVQHLERQLEELETKHRELSQSYTSLDSTHQELKREADKLRQELDGVRNGNVSASASRSSSLKPSLSGDEWTVKDDRRGRSLKQETEPDEFYDPFCGSSAPVPTVEHQGEGIDFFQDNNGQVAGSWTY